MNFPLTGKHEGIHPENYFDAVRKELKLADFEQRHEPDIWPDDYLLQLAGMFRFE